MIQYKEDEIHGEEAGIDLSLDELVGFFVGRLQSERSATSQPRRQGTTDLVVTFCSELVIDRVVGDNLEQSRLEDFPSSDFIFPSLSFSGLWRRNRVSDRSEEMRARERTSILTLAD